MKVQRLLIIKLHAILACFILPMATLYFVSGALYSSDIKGHIDKQVYKLTLERPLTPDLTQLSALAKTALDQHGLLPPGGKSSIKETKKSYEYRWGDLKRLVVIAPGDDPLQAELIYRERDPLARVMRVHRAEAGALVKIYSTSMAIALLVILSSGVFLALGMPKLRRSALLALGVGLLLSGAIFI